MLHRLRGMMTALFTPVARALLRIGVTPDAVTIAGTVAVVVIALWTLPTGHLLLGALLLGGCVLTDSLDGVMARLAGRAGPWGAFLDSTLDRVGDAAILGGIAMGFVNAGDARTAAVAIACLVGGLVVSYAKARAEGVGAECNVGIAERTERLIIQGIGVVLYGFGVPYALPVALWVLLVLTWVTVGQRIWHVRTQLLVAPEDRPA